MRLHEYKTSASAHGKGIPMPLKSSEDLSRGSATAWRRDLVARRNVKRLEGEITGRLTKQQGSMQQRVSEFIEDSEV